MLNELQTTQSHPSLDADTYEAALAASSRGQGCDTCGSKWHLNKDCPLHKLKERRSATPQEATPLGGRSARMQRHGFAQEVGPTSAVHFHIPARDPPDQDPELEESNKNKTDDSLSPGWVRAEFFGHRQHDLATASRPTATSLPERDFANTSFLVQVLHEGEDLEAYHQCHGEKRYGFVIDPGASGGLTGTDSAADFLENVTIPQNMPASLQPSAKQFSGISGRASSTLGAASLGCRLGRLAVDYKTDLIGSTGSLCP